MKITIFRHVTSYSLVKIYCYFTVTFCSRLQGRRVSLKLRLRNIKSLTEQLSHELNLPTLCNTHKLRVQEMTTSFFRRKRMSFLCTTRQDSRKLLSSIQAATWHMSSLYGGSVKKIQRTNSKAFFLTGGWTRIVLCLSQSILLEYWIVLERYVVRTKRRILCNSWSLCRVSGCGLYGYMQEEGNFTNTYR